MQKKRLGIIGGTGFDSFVELSNKQTTIEKTPFGLSCEMVTGEYQSNTIVFMPRHGVDHVVAPHSINYRANIWALKKIGITHVLAVNAVGGIAQNLAPGVLAIPDQIIDYTYGREHTFYGNGSHSDSNALQSLSEEQKKDIKQYLPLALDHIDFTSPYSEPWRNQVVSLAKQLVTEQKLSDSLVLEGIYGCTQGPRLETAAEIQRLRNDGCTMVGMTAMPEAALAKELGLNYASIAMSVNWAAGLSQEMITMELIKRHIETAMKEVKILIEDLSANMMN